VHGGKGICLGAEIIARVANQVVTVAIPRGRQPPHAQPHISPARARALPSVRLREMTAERNPAIRAEAWMSSNSAHVRHTSRFTFTTRARSLIMALTNARFTKRRCRTTARYYSTSCVSEPSFAFAVRMWRC